MSPLAVFFRTLSRSSAVCLGVGLAIVNPSWEWSSRGHASGRIQIAGVTAQKSPTEAAIDGLIIALKDSDAGVRLQAADRLAGLRNPRAVPALMEALKDQQTRGPDARGHGARRAR